MAYTNFDKDNHSVSLQLNMKLQYLKQSVAQKWYWVTCIFLQDLRIKCVKCVLPPTRYFAFNVMYVKCNCASVALDHTMSRRLHPDKKYINNICTK